MEIEPAESHDSTPPADSPETREEPAAAVPTRETRPVWAQTKQVVPPADRDKVVNAAHHAFVTGFNTIALVSVAVAAVGSVAGDALVRSRDFVAAGGPAPAPEPAQA